MKKTGVFATQDEFNDLLNLARKGWMDGDTLIVSSAVQGIMKDQATTDAKMACHKIALSYGLPEIRGYYGIDKHREFLEA